MASVDPDTVPFWGVSDSNIQWCEEDYAVTPYLAEFWNSLSSIPLFLWGLFGLYMYYQHGEKEKRCVLWFFERHKQSVMGEGYIHRGFRGQNPDMSIDFLLSEETRCNDCNILEASEPTEVWSILVGMLPVLSCSHVFGK